MLHLLSRSPHNDPALYQRVCSSLNQGDALLLMGEGVIGAVGIADENLPETKDVCLYVLKDDLETRGLGLLPNAAFSLISMDDFVSLTAQHTQTVSWY